MGSKNKRERGKMSWHDFFSWLRGYVGKDCEMLIFRERKLERECDDLCLRS